MVLHTGLGGLEAALDAHATSGSPTRPPGEKGRINSTFAEGPANLVTAVTQLGIPIQHYLEINFVSFAKLVDAVGGHHHRLPGPGPRHPLRARRSTRPDPYHLDGEQALAYVRSRYYEQLIDGTWQTDPTADIGRTERQRAFLTALMDKVGGTRNPFTLLGAPGPDLLRDQASTAPWATSAALRLVWSFRSFHPATVALPVTPRTTSGGAAVLDLKQPDAGTRDRGVRVSRLRPRSRCVGATLDGSDRRGALRGGRDRRARVPTWSLSPATRCSTARGTAVVPGLVNGHTHAAMTLLRSFGDDMSLQPWLRGADLARRGAASRRTTSTGGRGSRRSR